MRFLFSILFLWIALPAMAAPEILARLEATQVNPGQSTRLTIFVQGVRKEISKPIAPIIDGLQFGELGLRQETISNINGISTNVIFSFAVNGLTEGPYQIPAIELTADGEVLTTEPLILTIKKGVASAENDPFLVIEAGKTEFYVGETIPISLTLYLHPNTDLRSWSLPDIEREGFTLKRFPQNPTGDREDVGGIYYKSYKFVSSFVATKAGQSTLGPASAECTIDMPTGRHPTFRHLLGSGDLRRFKPVSNEVALNVLPLPTEGQPQDFSGAIGTFALEAAASPLALKSGEPISMEMSITGIGTFESIQAPVITDPEGWRLYPAKEYTEADRTALGAKRVTYSQVIIPENEKTEIPPFSFSYFDPNDGAYKSLATPAMPIEVMPNDAFPPQTSVTASSTTDLTPLGQPEAKITDILTVLPLPENSAPTRPLHHKRAIFLAAQAVPATALVLISLGAIRARRRASALTPDSPEARLQDALAELNSKELTGAPLLAKAHQVLELSSYFPQSSTLLDSEKANEIRNAHARIAYTGADSSPTENSVDRKAILSTLSPLSRIR